MEEGQFQLDMYCNLPFALAPIDYQLVPSPVLTTRQKSVLARQQADEAKRERDRKRNILLAQQQARRAELQVRVTGWRWG